MALLSWQNWMRIAAYALGTWMAFAVAAMPVHAAEPVPSVLVLHSNQRATPVHVVIDDTLRKVVPDELKRPVQIFSEYLDDEWASLQTYGAAEAEFLRAKYSRRNVRVIVAAAIPALQFAAEFRDRIFPGVPIVYLAVARDRLERMALPANILGVVEDHDPTPTLQLALRLHPDAKRLVIVRGASERDRLWDTRLRTALDRLESVVEIERLAGLPTAEVLRRVGALAQGTVVFTPGYFVDGAGEISSARQSTERIAGASTVPVYGAFDTHIGAGIVGGYMSRFEDQAMQAGAIVVGLLNGTAASEIGSTLARRVPMVDWRQVRRWDIDERRLPAETIVSFREPSVWDKYWREISLAVAILVAQAGLIAALLVQRRRRHVAEHATQALRSEVAHASRLAVAGELTASIAHEINQPLGAILSNADAADLLLQSGEDRRDLLRQIMADIRRDDVRASEVIRRLRALLARHEVEQKPFDLSAAVTEAVAMLQVEAGRRQVAIDLRPAPTANVIGDRVQIQQVLINLLLNAIDAVGDADEDRRTVVVAVSSADGHIVISVRDRGHGISSEQVPKLFDSFFSTKRAGMGVGLSIARTIVEAHGGRIWAESTLGDGAVFHVELPATERIAAHAQAEAAE